jgi:hypothetical protein
VAWSYEFYAEDDGSVPVRTFLESLSDAELGKTIQALTLL